MRLVIYIFVYLLAWPRLDIFCLFIKSRLKTFLKISSSWSKGIIVMTHRKSWTTHRKSWLTHRNSKYFFNLNFKASRRKKYFFLHLCYSLVIFLSNLNALDFVNTSLFILIVKTNVWISWIFFFLFLVLKWTGMCLQSQIHLSLIEKWPKNNINAKKKIFCLLTCLNLNLKKLCVMILNFFIILCVIQFFLCFSQPFLCVIRIDPKR